MSKTIELFAGPNGSEIPACVKEKERRYKKQKALAERVFGDVVKQIQKERSSK